MKYSNHQKKNTSEVGPAKDLSGPLYNQLSARQCPCSFSGQPIWYLYRNLCTAQVVPFPPVSNIPLMTQNNTFYSTKGDI
jgi:hypothetical protein